MKRNHLFSRSGIILVLSLFLFGQSTDAKAFWLLNFSTAATLPSGGIGFIGGTGGQFTSVGAPATSNLTPFLAHAGIRFGLSDRLDLGYRLCTVPLPYSSVGPSLGAETDLKLRLTPKNTAWQVAVIGGVGYSYLLISNATREAWSPGADVVVTRPINEHVDLSWNGRFVYTAITSAPGGAAANQVEAIGGSMGARFALSPTINLMPELGVFDFLGTIGGNTMNGWGFQYGVVLSARVL